MSWYRRTIFNYRGNREFTKQGYETASVNFNPADLDVDCSDRHYMITGSNSGIGFETAVEIAKRGGILHMVCRNPEKAKEARSEIITNTGNDKITVYIVDLSKPREVFRWAREWAETHTKLNVLVHNAGCMLHQRQVDQDGVEANFATNTLAVHILTKCFTPILQKNPDPRVIIVSSGGMYTMKLDPVDLSLETMEPFDGRAAYSQNKRQQVVMNMAYAQSISGVHFSCMHPGWADTVAVRTSIPQFYEMMKDSLRTAAQGADTVVWLAVSPSAIKYPSGFFFQDRVPVSTHFPLAWTKSSLEEEQLFMSKLEGLIEIISDHSKVEVNNTNGNVIQENQILCAVSNDTTSQNNGSVPVLEPTNQTNGFVPVKNDNIYTTNESNQDLDAFSKTNNNINPVISNDKCKDEDNLNQSTVNIINDDDNNNLFNSDGQESDNQHKETKSTDPPSNTLASNEINYNNNDIKTSAIVNNELSEDIVEVSLND